MKSKLIKSVLPVFALIVLLGAIPLALHAQGMKKPSGTIELSQWKVGFIAGVGGGGGKLIFQGKSYPVSIHGLRIGATIGVATADLIGEVYNLTEPKDIEGTFTSAQAAIAVAGGAKVWTLQNKRKVTLKLRGKQIGLELALDVGGMSLKLK